MTALEQAVGGERFAPRPLLQQLRQVDPAAELVHIGDGTWWVGSYRPNIKNRAVGSRKRQIAREMTDIVEARRLERVGALQQAGFVFIAEYEFQGEPDARIARHLEYADWMDRVVVTTDERYGRTLNAHKEREREQARKELADPWNALDAWKSGFTLQHSMTQGYTNYAYNLRMARKRALNNGELLT